MAGVKTSLSVLLEQIAPTTINVETLTMVLHLLADNVANFYVEDIKSRDEHTKQQVNDQQIVTRNNTKSLSSAKNPLDKVPKQRIQIPWHSILGLKDSQSISYASLSRRPDKLDKNLVVFEELTFRIPEQRFEFSQEMVLPSYQLVTVLCKKPLIWVERRTNLSPNSTVHIVLGIMERYDEYMDSKTRKTYCEWGLYVNSWENISEFAECLRKAEFENDFQDADKEDKDILRRLSQRYRENTNVLFRDFVTGEVAPSVNRRGRSKSRVRNAKPAKRSHSVSRERSASPVAKAKKTSQRPKSRSPSPRRSSVKRGREPSPSEEASSEDEEPVRSSNNRTRARSSSPEEEVEPSRSKSSRKERRGESPVRKSKRTTSPVRKSRARSPSPDYERGRKTVETSKKSSTTKKSREESPEPSRHSRRKDRRDEESSPAPKSKRESSPVSKSRARSPSPHSSDNDSEKESNPATPSSKDPEDFDTNDILDIPKQSSVPVAPPHSPKSTNA